MVRRPNLSNRRPSRLSVVSSALSSASSDDDEMNLLGSDDAEGEEEEMGIDDGEGEEDISEDEVEDDEDSRASSALPSRNATPARGQAAKGASKSAPNGKGTPLKITLKRASPTQAKKAGSSASKTSKKSVTVANNRGNKVVQSESSNSEEEEDEDAEGEIDEMEDELEDSEDELDDAAESSNAALQGADDWSDDEEEDPEASFIANMPKTARQLAREGGGETLMQLPLRDDSKKQKITEAELALKRSELARRRRYQSEKKLDDEKTETINRLLKKQVGKKSTREYKKEDAEGGPVGDDEGEEGDEMRRKRREGPTREQLKNRPAPFFRSIIRAEGTTVSIPLPVASNAETNKAMEDSPYWRKWEQTFSGARPKIEMIGSS